VSVFPFRKKLEVDLILRRGRDELAIISALSDLWQAAWTPRCFDARRVVISCVSRQVVKTSPHFLLKDLGVTTFASPIRVFFSFVGY